jgi:hypothetical protein
MPEDYPEAAFRLLYLVIDRNQRFYKADLEKLLTRISQNWPDSANDSHFRILKEFSAS